MSTVFSILNAVSFICKLLGIKPYTVSVETVLRGLDAAAKDEATQVAEPLELFCKGFDRDTNIGLIPRFMMVKELKEVLISRARITRALREYPEVKQV